MLNVLRMDLFHLIKTRTLYVITGIMTLYCALITVLFTVLPEELNGITDLALIKITSFDVFLVYVTFPAAGSFVFMGIFWSIFMSSDYSQGFIKNLAGQISRNKLVASKFITMLVYTTIMYVWSYIVTNVVSLVFASKSVSFSFDFVAFLEVLLMFFGIMSLIFFMTYLTGKSLIAIIFTFMISMGVFRLAFSLISFLLKKAFGLKVLLEKGTITYYMDDIFNKASCGFKISGITTGVIISAVFVVVFFFLSQIVYKKRDINA